MRYIICYDISEQKIRTKVAKYLESFAHRMQYSVFGCESSEKTMESVRKELLQLTADAENPLLFIAPMCRACIEKAWMVGEPLERTELYIIA